MKSYYPYYDLKYEPESDDIVCTFSVEPAAGVSMKDAVSAVAAESSIGTWTELTTMPKEVQDVLKARVFNVEGHKVEIAYPYDLFEEGNVPQIMSSVAGNVFGMNVLKSLRLEDIKLPDKMLASFKGPAFGVDGVRKLLRVNDRPLVGTIIKPKLGLDADNHARVAYEAWVGGCDVVKDDENLTNQWFNPFRERVIKTLAAKFRAEQKTGEKKVYMPNTTAETNEMVNRAQFIKEHGGEYAMIDILTTGFAGMQSLRDADTRLVLHAHRAMHAALTRNKKHGISMVVLAKLARMIGMDQLHIGTGVGKMEGGMQEVAQIRKDIQMPWGHIKPTFAVCSGGLQPGNVQEIYSSLGKDIIIQMGGGIHGHPHGTQTGATAARQAIDAAVKGIPAKKYAKTHKPLAEALKQWRS